MILWYNTRFDVYDLFEEDKHLSSADAGEGWGDIPIESQLVNCEMLVDNDYLKRNIKIVSIVE